LIENFPDVVGMRGGETRDVDVRHAGVAPLGLPLRPAHQLDTAIADLRRKLHDLSQREVRQDRADKPEFHEGVPGTAVQSIHLSGAAEALPRNDSKGRPAFVFLAVAGGKSRGETSTSNRRTRSNPVGNSGNSDPARGGIN